MSSRPKADGSGPRNYVCIASLLRATKLRMYSVITQGHEISYV